MSRDTTYQLLVTKMREVSEFPPQSVGPFTGIYKRVVPFLKNDPWKRALPISFLIAFLMYIAFGLQLVKLASLLQFGF